MRQAALEKAVEFEVVPRLLMAHYVAPVGEPRHDDPGRFSDAVNELVVIVLGPRPDRARDFIQDRVDHDVTLEDIYLQLIEPAARRLKRLWAEDERDFADVTLGLWRLQQLLRDFSVAFRRHASRPNGQRALLTLGPGATQDLPFLMFGLVLSSEFFRRDGWEPWIEPESIGNELIVLIRSEWFDVVEILITSERRLDVAAKRIQSIRNESLNRSACIAIGGLGAHPELVASLGGDVLAADLNDAQTRNRYLSDTPKRRRA